MTELEERLNNPAWHALTNQHAKFALGDDLSRRYQRDFTSLAGMAANSQEAFHSLATLIAPNEAIGLIGTHPPLEDGWMIMMQIHVLQMVYAGPSLEPSEPPSGMRSLTPADLPAVFQLIEMTRPGPFQARSMELGHYLSIWQEERLVAMAGERMHLPGYHEISTVCTHPAYQRRGYARQLTQQLIYEMQQAGDIPFLHVFTENKSAQNLYQSMGFQGRAELPLFVLKRQS